MTNLPHSGEPADRLALLVAEEDTLQTEAPHEVGEGDAGYLLGLARAYAVVQGIDPYSDDMLPLVLGECRTIAVSLPEALR